MPLLTVTGTCGAADAVVDKYCGLQTERVTKYVKGLDPSRLYNPASGWIDVPVGDLIDMHKYVGPGKPLSPTLATPPGLFHTPWCDYCTYCECMELLAVYI